MIPISKKFDVTYAGKGKDNFWNPLYYSSRVILGFLQGLFNANEPGRYHWDPDPELTEILITDQAPITTQAVNIRPAIVAMISPATYANISMNSLLHADHTNRREFVDLISSTVTLNCLSKVAVDAHRLAWFTGSMMKAHRHFLQKAGPFHEIAKDITFLNETPAGALLRDSADGGTINCSVMIPFRIAHKWAVTEKAVELKKISAFINQRTSEAMQPETNSLSFELLKDTGDASNG